MYTIKVLTSLKFTRAHKICFLKFGGAVESSSQFPKFICSVKHDVQNLI